MAIYITARPWEDLKRGAQLGTFFFRIQLRNYVSKNIYIYIFTKYNTLLNIQTYNFPTLCLRSIDGNSVANDGTKVPCIGQLQG
jgi:hypothetical protein